MNLDELKCHCGEPLRFAELYAMDAMHSHSSGTLFAALECGLCDCGYEWTIDPHRPHAVDLEITDPCEVAERDARESAQEYDPNLEDARREGGA